MATDKLVDFDHVTDYISREAAYKTLTEYYHHSSGVQHTVLREALNRVPTADVRPVVRGKWIDVSPAHIKVFRCDQCGEETTDTCLDKPRANFCPNCGADMRANLDTTKGDNHD